MAVSPTAQKEQVRAARDADPPMQEGQTYYLVSQRWWRSWASYTGYYDDKQNNRMPDRVNNADLIDPQTGELKANLLEGADFVVLSQSVWDLIIAWYGGGPPLPRKAIRDGATAVRPLVEIYLRTLVIEVAGSSEPPLKVSVSKATKVRELRKLACDHFGLSEDKVQVWNYYYRVKYAEMDKLDATVNEYHLEEGQCVLIEVADEHGRFPPATGLNGTSNGASTSKASTAALALARRASGDRSSSDGGAGKGKRPRTEREQLLGRYASINDSDASPGRRDDDFHDKNNGNGTIDDDDDDGNNGFGNGLPARGGLTGLMNLGNTCFMNSGLQCLSNTVPLTEYFLSGRYKRDLNPDNPIGMKGEIASRFAELLRQLWTGNASMVPPRDFKWTLAQYAPQFSGYSQHDSQELLAFLLDGLHEDLNRVKKKPFVEAVEGRGRPDAIVAEEAWEAHRKRNDSIIVDLFQGQLKSTLVCPQCSTVSVTFDPFMYLGLPLPSQTKKTINVLFVPDDAAALPVMYGVEVKLGRKIKSLKANLAAMCGVPPDQLCLVEVYGQRVLRGYKPSDEVEDISDMDEIYAFQVSSTHVPQVRASYSTYSYGRGYSSRSSSPEQKAVPEGKINVPVVIRSRPTPRSRSSSSSGNGFGSTYYGSSTYEYTPLVATPFIVTLSETGLQHGQVRDLLMKRVRRFINFAAEIPRDTLHAEAADKQAAGDPGNWPFRLRWVNSSGSSVEAEIPTDEAFDVRPEACLSMDFDEVVFKAMFDEEAMKKVKLDKSADTGNGKDKSSAVTLDQCLQLFQQTEELGEEDKWYCPKCKDFVQASKKFDIWKVPEVLVVHLKRFSYNHYWRDKLDTLVDAPTRGLDMSPYVIGPQRGTSLSYDLFAVSNHYGGMGGGHYTAYAINATDGKWHTFDDSLVSSASEDQVISTASYVLFYRLRSRAAAS